jgi:hypothetical protein
MVLSAAVFAILGCSVAARAQGISSARDGNGNLVERSAPHGDSVTPMANARIRSPAQQAVAIRGVRPRITVIHAPRH